MFPHRACCTSKLIKLMHKSPQSFSLSLAFLCSANSSNKHINLTRKFNYAAAEKNDSINLLCNSIIPLCVCVCVNACTFQDSY